MDEQQRAIEAQLAGRSDEKHKPFSSESKMSMEALQRGECDHHHVDSLIIVSAQVVSDGSMAFEPFSPYRTAPPLRRAGRSESLIGMYSPARRRKILARAIMVF